MEENRETLLQHSHFGVVDILIPALNEEEALPLTLEPLLKKQNIFSVSESAVQIRQIIVIDNGSSDRTAEVAQKLGVTVIHEAKRGYGYACLAGITTISEDPPQAVLFLDADGSDDVADTDCLLALLQLTTLDDLDPDYERVALKSDLPPALVIGSRPRLAEVEALTSLQRFGNALSCRLLKWIFGAEFTDLGPFRVVRWEALMMMKMSDPTYGWTVEMQAKACALNLTTLERDVRYHPRRAGKSKISGTLKGSFKAGIKILWTIVKAWWTN